MRDKVTIQLRLVMFERATRACARPNTEFGPPPLFSLLHVYACGTMMSSPFFMEIAGLVRLLCKREACAFWCMELLSTRGTVVATRQKHVVIQLLGMRRAGNAVRAWFYG